MHLAGSSGNTLTSAVILSETYLIKDTKRRRGFQLKTEQLNFRREMINIVVTGPANADAKTSIDQIVFKNDTMTTYENGGGQFVLGIALDHVLNVGKDSRIAVIWDIR
jgi:hypothetical protein